MREDIPSLIDRFTRSKFFHSPRSCLLLALSVLSSASLGAERLDVALRQSADGKFQVVLYKSGVIRLTEEAAKVSVGNSEIADIEPMSEKQLYVLGRSLGTTNVLAWDKRGRLFEAFDLEVTHDLDTLKMKLHELLRGEPIKVHSAQGKIVMSGEVSNIVKMNAALQLAASFLPECAPGAQGGGTGGGATPGGATAGGAAAGQAAQQGCSPDAIVNMMQVAGAQQVMLEIKVAEIARDVLKRLDPDTNLLLFGSDAQIGINKGGAALPDGLFDVRLPDGQSAQRNIPIFGTDTIVGPDIKDLQRNVPVIDESGLIFSYLTGDFLFEAVLDASRSKGLGKILAEPTLTTITGQEAKFLSGGEFPIPVPGDATRGTTIEFKEFGVGVKFLLVVLDSGRINLKINVEVSELSQANPVLLQGVDTSNVFVIPALTKRSASSAVELADGQSIGIAGLLNESTRELVDKFPGVGDVPVLGTLFRSQEFRQGQTELVIFVTPHLARPIAPHQVRLPTDSFVPPDDLEFYLMGRMESRKAPAAANQVPGAAAIPTQEAPNAGKFGHDL